jgi:hypothetical protein
LAEYTQSCYCHKAAPLSPGFLEHLNLTESERSGRRRLRLEARDLPELAEPGAQVSSPEQPLPFSFSPASLSDWVPGCSGTSLFTLTVNLQSSTVRSRQDLHRPYFYQSYSGSSRSRSKTHPWPAPPQRGGWEPNLIWAPPPGPGRSPEQGAQPCRRRD